MASEANYLNEQDLLNLLMVCDPDASLGEFVAAGTRVRPDLFSWVLGEMSHGSGHAAGNVAFKTKQARDTAVDLHFIWWNWLKLARFSAAVEDLTNLDKRHIVDT
jgi:hypothetical protein